MKKIEVFSTPVCKYCKEMKAFLDERGLKYTEHNVAGDKEQLTRLIELSGRRSVPVAVIGKHVLAGWNEKEMISVLKKEGFSL